MPKGTDPYVICAFSGNGREVHQWNYIGSRWRIMAEHTAPSSQRRGEASFQSRGEEVQRCRGS